MLAIRCSNLVKRYDGKPPVEAVRGLDLAVSFAGLFGIQLFLRREVEEDPDEREAIEKAIRSLAVTGTEVVRDPSAESELIKG